LPHFKRAGRSAEELVASIEMDAYKGWGSYEAWRGLNGSGMAKYLAETGQAD